MKDYLQVANSPYMYIGVVLLLGIVCWQAGVFINRSLKRAQVLGIPREKINKTVKVAALTSLVPSFAIVVALLTLAPVLGLPFSWTRLSIIGSLSYELLAADIGAKAAGVTLGGAGYGSSAFLASVCTQTIGSFVTLGLTIFGFKWYKDRLNKSLKKAGDKSWSRILIAAIIVSMYSRFMAEPVARGGVALVTMLVSAASMILVGLLIKKCKLKWLSDFAISLSMIVGMAAAIVYSF